MSTNNQRVNTGSQATTDYDLSKIFVWNNRYKTGIYTNSSYNPEVLLPGQLMGRVAATQALVKCFSAAADGSQYPIGILADGYTVTEGVATNISICDVGDIPSDKIIFESNDNLSTLVNGRSMLDHMQVLGLNIISSTEMTDFDN